MVAWILERVPWYNATEQALREHRVKLAHARAIRARMDAERAIRDYEAVLRPRHR